MHGEVIYMFMPRYDYSLSRFQIKSRIYLFFSFSLNEMFYCSQQKRHNISKSHHENSQIGISRRTTYSLRTNEMRKHNSI